MKFLFLVLFSLTFSYSFADDIRMATSEDINKFDQALESAVKEDGQLIDRHNRINKDFKRNNDSLKNKVKSRQFKESRQERAAEKRPSVSMGRGRSDEAKSKRRNFPSDKFEQREDRAESKRRNKKRKKRD